MLKNLSGRWRALVAGAAVMLVMGPGSAVAQTTRGSVAGTIRDAQGAAVPGATIELRSPRPFSFGGFDEFNGAYRQLLESWGLLVDGVNPIARTNVAPVVGPPAEPSLFGFSYTVPSAASGPPTFVVAGSGDRSFDVTFATQTAAGDYSIRVGPEVTDVTGTKMNAWSGSFRLNAVVASAPPAIVGAQGSGATANSLNRVRVTFDRSMNVNTFTAADVRVRLLRRSGALTPETVTQLQELTERYRLLDRPFGAPPLPSSPEGMNTSARPLAATPWRIASTVGAAGRS